MTKGTKVVTGGVFPATAAVAAVAVLVTAPILSARGTGSAAQDGRAPALRLERTLTVRPSEPVSLGPTDQEAMGTPGGIDNPRFFLTLYERHSRTNSADLRPRLRPDAPAVTSSADGKTLVVSAWSPARAEVVEPVRQAALKATREGANAATAVKSRNESQKAALEAHTKRIRSISVRVTPSELLS